jgi:DNA-binding transcriptional regulator PaaX
MPGWSFLTNHARALACIAHNPEVRLIDIASALGITERNAFSIVTDLANEGYVIKEKDGRRNRYRIEAEAAHDDSIGRKQTVGELVDLLVDSGPRRRRDRAGRA